jgi:putative zinc finger protein
MMSFRQHVQSYLHQFRHDHYQGDDCHPRTETLRAYHRGTLPSLQMDQVQEHLATCAECADLFLGLVNYLEWDLDPTRLSVEDLTHSWQRFLQRRSEGADLESAAADAVTEERRALCSTAQD